METLNKGTPKVVVADDLTLVELVNQGEVDAFEALYLRHRDWVFRLAFRFTADEALALDVMQETFLYLLRKFPGFRLHASFRTFLYPAVRNLSIAARRKARRCQSDAEGLDALNHLAAIDLPPGRLQDLQAVLSRLSHEHREVLLLRFLEGLSLEEIALATEVPVGTVKSRLHNALKMLREDPRTRELFVQ
jgi:RNA polymerase sigma-70 factor (ECF subfamily)